MNLEKSKENLGEKEVTHFWNLTIGNSGRGKKSRRDGLARNSAKQNVGEKTLGIHAPSS